MKSVTGADGYMTHPKAKTIYVCAVNGEYEAPYGLIRCPHSSDINNLCKAHGNMQCKYKVKGND